VVEGLSELVIMRWRLEQRQDALQRSNVQQWSRLQSTKFAVEWLHTVTDACSLSSTLILVV